MEKASFNRKVVNVGANVRLLRVELGDEAALSGIACAAYRPYYAYLWHEGGMDWYLNRCYNEAQLSQEIADENVEYWFVEYEEKTMGFVKLNVDSALNAEPAQTALEIQRIYFLPEARGKGIGRKVFAHIEVYAKSLGKGMMWLYAMDSAKDAYHAYQALGFEQCGSKFLDFPQMKQEYWGMVALKKMLY